MNHFVPFVSRGAKRSKTKPGWRCCIRGSVKSRKKQECARIWANVTLKNSPSVAATKRLTEILVSFGFQSASLNGRTRSWPSRREVSMHEFFFTQLKAAKERKFKGKCPGLNSGYMIRSKFFKSKVKYQLKHSPLVYFVGDLCAILKVQRLNSCFKFQGTQSWRTKEASSKSQKCYSAIWSGIFIRHSFAFVYNSFITAFMDEHKNQSQTFWISETKH